MRLPLKRAHKAARAALLALSFVAISNAHAANDWVNFGTVSMTNATTPKLTNNYLCYTDGKDIACDTSVGPVYVGTAGIINNGGMTVAGSVSASAVSATYVSGTVIQVNTSAMPCSTGLAGAIRYNSGNIEYCNGSAWGQLANGSGGTLSGGSATAIAFWSGPTTLTYESATTTGLYWDHVNGRLGVGTTTPTLALTVDARNNVDGLLVRGSNAPYIQVSNTGGLGLGQIGIATQANQFGLGTSVGDFSIGSLNGNLFLTGRGAATSAIIMGTGPSSNQERMRIDVNGNVGVNTQSPTATLQVSGTFTVSNSTNPNSPSLYVPSNGSVGVFTTTPAPNALDVSGDIRVSNGGGATEKALFMRFNPALNSGVLGTYDWNAGSYLNTMIWAGNLAIGTGGTYPSSLTVANGEIQTASSGAACVSASNGGAIRYSGGTLYYCNGANTWSTISGGGAGFTGGGSATAIAFWNGTNSLTYESATTSGLYWDHTNGRLGIGNNVPVVPLDVSGSSVVGADIARFLSSGLSSGQFVQMFLGRATSSGETATWTYTEGASGGISSFGLYGNRIMLNLNAVGNVGVGTMSPYATLQVSGSMIVSTTGQNSLSSASLAVDSRGVSVSSIVHINGSAFSPIGAGGNAILSGTTAVSTSSAGSITFTVAGSPVMIMDGSGAIGIGTTALGSGNKLIVNGGNIRLTGSNAPAVYISATSGDVYAFGVNTSIPGAGVWDNNTGQWPISIKDTSNFVGINTIAQTYRLTVSGDSGNGSSFKKAAIGIEDTGTSGRTYSLGSRGSAGFVLGDDTAGVARMVIAPNGVFTLTGTSTCTLANGTGTTSCTSDRRLKERIEPIKDPLDKLMLIKGVTYHWKRKDISGPEHIGVIAQDVEKAFPQAVTEVSDTTIGTAKTVDYAILVAPIIEVIRDFKHRFESTDVRLKAANDNIQTLSNEVEELRQEVRELKQQRQ